MICRIQTKYGFSRDFPALFQPICLILTTLFSLTNYIWLKDCSNVLNGPKEEINFHLSLIILTTAYNQKSSIL